jgi:hypothetical protein
MNEPRDPYRNYEQQREIERRTVATGAVACAREALRIVAEVDAGRLPRGRAAALLNGCLGMHEIAARHLLDSKPEPTPVTAPMSEGPLVTVIQQVLAFTGPPQEAHAMLKKTLEDFQASNGAAPSRY